jgi:hypothetical protein
MIALFVSLAALVILTAGSLINLIIDEQPNDLSVPLVVGGRLDITA